MKFSNYNVLSENQCLVFNTLNLTLAKLNRSDYNAFKSKDLTQISIVDELFENGFLIDDIVNEEDYIKNIYWSSKYSNDVLNLSILTTKQCNFRCDYCFEIRDNSNLKGESLSNLIEFISSYACKYKSININWYGGEPLLNFEPIVRITDSLIPICKLYNLEYFANITTNGYLLTKNCVDELVKLKVCSAQITLDGEKRTHDLRRKLYNGRGTYTTILDNLKYATTKMYVELRINVDNDNINHILGLLDDIAELKLENLGLSVCMVTPRENGICDINWEKEMTRKIIEIYKYAIQKRIRVSKLSELLIKSNRFCVVDSDSQFTITPNGSVYKCGESFIDANDPGYIGKIVSEGNMDIDIEKKLIWLKDPFNDFKCMSCQILPICFGGCVLKKQIKGMTPCIHEFLYEFPAMIDILYDFLQME